MAKIIESRRILKSRFNAKQDVSRAIPALMGDGNGNVAIANQPGYVYVRIGDGDLGQAFNNRCPQRDNLSIYVGYDPVIDPDRRTFQVLSVRMADYADAGVTPTMNVPPHHAYHEYGGGDDTLIDWRRLMGFRVGRPSVFNVTVDPGILLRAGAWKAIAAQTLALAAMKPVGVQACYVLIALNSLGVATATPGANHTIATLNISHCPIPAAGEIPLAAVRLYGVQTAIGDTPSAPDIVDLRFPQSAMAGTVYLSSLSGWARGSIIRGGAAVWESYAKGAAFTVLTGDGTDTLWSGYLLSGTAGGKTNFAVTAAKTLTLTATDDYNLTAEITGAVIVRSATPNIVATPLAGNARGMYAVDLQLVRANVAQVASGPGSVAVGGRDNTASNDWSTVCGGYGNTASGEQGTAIGGNNNVASGNLSTTIGGSQNTCSGNNSIAGVYGTIAAGQYCIALGTRAKTGANNGVFMWGDSTSADFNGIVANEFALRARGGFRHAYDDSNYWTAKVASNGVTTFATLPVGAGFIFTPAITLSSVTASTVVYANASQVLVSLANAAGYLENDGAGALSWSASTPPSAHDILSASHGDTLAAAVVDGSIIIGNVTPKWSALAISIPAADVRNVLGIDNGELRPSWKTALDATNPTTIGIADAGGPGTSLVFSHRDHQHPSPATWTAAAHAIDGATHTVAGRTAGQVLIATAAAVFGWSGFLLSGTAGGSVNFAVTNAKTLTLTAANDLNLTMTGGATTLGFGATGRIYTFPDTAGTVALLEVANVFTALQSVTAPYDVNNGIVKLQVTGADNVGMSWWCRAAGANANSRNWQISANYYAYGDLVFMQSTTNSGNPTTAQATLTATGLTVVAGFGCNSKTAQAGHSIGAALAAYATGAFGLNSDANMSALVAQVKAIALALKANGIAVV